MINIEDDDHAVEQWKGANGGPYIYIEDLIKRFGVCRLLFNSNGTLVCQELPDGFGPEVFWERASECLEFIELYGITEFNDKYYRGSTES